MDPEDFLLFKRKALQWASNFDVCCCLDSNGYDDRFGHYEFMLAAGAARSVEAQAGNAFDTLKHFYSKDKPWMFGLFGYDLKNETERLRSENIDGLEFPDLFFFVPEYLIIACGTKIEVVIGETHILKEIDRQETFQTPDVAIQFQQRISKQAYLEIVSKLKNHISRGDIYEINFCQEFFANQAYLDPAGVYQQLKAISPTPFSGFLKMNDKYILCASPERFICKHGERLISQPIKGTAPRGSNADADQLIRERLKTDMKEQTENVMIVDLVRNDLTKSAKKGTVKVEELFGIYAFPQVYQMISTVTCERDAEVDLIDVIKNAFPMGSMTGAPKVSALKLSEEYERSKRGAYSGALGYFTPSGNFDFNVVIRSILYNETKHYVSFQVGSAITHTAVAENEYEECLLKASAIMAVLNNKKTAVNSGLESIG